MATFILVAFTDPVFAHKIHGLAASVVAVAMLGPVFLVARRYVEVHGLLLHIDRLWRNDDGLRVDEARLWVVADIDAAVDARLVDSDGYANGGLPKGGGQSASGESKHCESFHEVPFRLEAIQRPVDKPR